MEARDHISGDTLIMIGAEGDPREDSGPPDGAPSDLVAEARNALPVLIGEIGRLRSELDNL